MACSIPDKIIAGTTFSHLVTLTAHPAPDWVLHLMLRGPLVIDIASTAEGAQHRLQASAAQTSEWPAGGYRWALRASLAGEVLPIDEGHITVAADLAAISEPIDGRSHAERVLHSIEAVLENRATLDQQRYVINNRELWRTPIADLLLLRDRYRAEVRREQQARRSGQSLLGRQVKVRF